MADQPVTIEWTAQKLKAFKKKYEKAKTIEAADSTADAFTFEGNVFVVSYAKYLIEYLETKFV